MKRAAGGSLKI